MAGSSADEADLAEDDRGILAGAIGSEASEGSRQPTFAGGRLWFLASADALMRRMVLAEVIGRPRALSPYRPGRGPHRGAGLGR